MIGKVFSVEAASTLGYIIEVPKPKIKAPTPKRVRTKSLSSTYSPTKAKKTKATIHTDNPVATIFLLPTLSEMNPKIN